MFKPRTCRRSVLAVAGVTAGVASVMVGPTAVNAQATDSQPEDQPSSRDVIKLEVPDNVPPAPASHGTCFSWSVAQGFLRGIPVDVSVPTTARGNNQRHCILRRNNNTDGVFKLQDAINRCYPGFSAGVGFDGDYGQNTERAVRQIQSLEGVSPVDGVYGPDTKTAMDWPAYSRSSGNFVGCGLLRV